MLEEPASPLTEWRSLAEELPTAARRYLPLLLAFQKVPEATDITWRGYTEHDTSACNTYSLTVIRELLSVREMLRILVRQLDSKDNPVLLYYHEKVFKGECYGWWYAVLEIDYF
jgi:hypothetical protein